MADGIFSGEASSCLGMPLLAPSERFPLPPCSSQVHALRSGLADAQYSRKGSRRCYCYSLGISLKFFYPCLVMSEAQKERGSPCVDRCILCWCCLAPSRGECHPRSVCRPQFWIRRVANESLRRHAWPALSQDLCAIV